MNWRSARVLLLLLAALGAADPAWTGEPVPEDPQGLYTYKTPSRDGIGKVYMGREISFTLGHRGVAWLERPEREGSEQPNLLVESLGLAADAVVADIGAGSGYFTFRISPLVPEGKVLAVDIQPQMLEEVERRRDKRAVTNVETVLGAVGDPNLPDGAVDAVLIVDAYHEFSHPREMMEAIFRDLEPGGRVFLVEYRAEDPDVVILPLHKMSEVQARKELEAVGLEFVENLGVLPQQHILVFSKPRD